MTSIPRRVAALAAFSILLACASCGGGGGSGIQPSLIPPILPIVTLVAGGGATNAGTIDALDNSGNAVASFITGNNQGLAATASGHIVQAGHPAGAGAGSLRVFAAPRRRFNGAGFDLRRDREIGPIVLTNPMLDRPKGIALAHGPGLVLVADNGAASIFVFPLGASGDVPPLAVTPTAAPPWDLAYDEAADRLFVALTNGSVEVTDDYVFGGFAAPQRTFFPADAMNAQVSVNLHGIAYDAAGDRLVVTDVGSAAVATDGQIFVVGQASTASGATMPLRTIGGPTSLLGNPVDCVLESNTLRVAEKSNNRILVFAGILTGGSGDIAPTSMQAAVAPESLVRVPAFSSALTPDVSDLDLGFGPDVLLVTSNPGVGQPLTGRVRVLPPDLSSLIAEFDAATSLESIVFDRDGDGYLSFDDGSDQQGGVRGVLRLARARDGGSFDATFDRQLTGPLTGLISPKGMDVDSERGIVFVAENSAAQPSIRVFSTQASGDRAPLYITDLGAFGRPWDLDYDNAADRLFVALTDGRCLVFDLFDTQQGQMPPTRIIVPSFDGLTQGSVNLHGIVHDAETDRLIVSDVGSPASASDGAIHVLPGASVLDGFVQPLVSIAGPQTMLGNPVDIAWDGTRLYVAEKSNDAVLRFDGLGVGGDRAPDLVFATDGPESVALVAPHTGSLP